MLRFYYQWYEYLLLSMVLSFCGNPGSGDRETIPYVFAATIVLDSVIGCEHRTPTESSVFRTYHTMNYTAVQPNTITSLHGRNFKISTRTGKRFLFGDSLRSFHCGKESDSRRSRLSVHEEGKKIEGVELALLATKREKKVV